jgi:DNA modification methylase
VLKDDGTLWLYIGDSYAGSNKGVMADGSIVGGAKQQTSRGTMDGAIQKGFTGPGLKPKDLIGIPWRVAFALQADGWWLRQDIIWAKPNPMPESVKDRCTKSHEYMFLLSKSARYYYDHEAIKETSTQCGIDRARRGIAEGSKGVDGAPGQTPHTIKQPRDFDPERDVPDTRNKRDVWTIPTKPFKGAHFAVMPEALVEPCVLAGSAEGDTVLDPFTGSGTVGVVALRHQRNFVGTELNPEYAEMALKRIHDDGPLLNVVELTASTKEEE